jgi:hypothetical protein
MIKMSINSTQFRKDMKNIVEYSFGFVDGVKAGKQLFFRNLGVNVKEILEKYIDSNARVNPQALHHVYEWYQTGNKNARLFDVTYTISNLGLSFFTNFKQSQTVKDGSNVPFYNKAKIMEEGTPVIIRPRNSDVLVFNDNGEEVFSKAPIRVENPGGRATSGSFEKIIDTFFQMYFTQAFLRSSGMADYLENPITYKQNLSSGKIQGRSKGISTGYKWIASAGVVANG